MGICVLVLGATGAQGRPVVEQLLQRGHTVRILGRRPGKAGSLVAKGAEFFSGDLGDYDSVEKAATGADAMFVLMPVDAWPPKVWRYLNNAIRAARTARVGHIVYTSSGSLTKRKLGVPFIDIKSELARRVADADVPVVVLAPSVFLDNLFSPFSYPAVRLKGELVSPYPVDGRISWITLEDQARHAVAALERPWLAGRTLKIACSDIVTGPQLATEFSRVLGKPIVYRSQSIWDFFRRATPALGLPAGIAISQVFHYHKRSGTELTVVEDAAETSLLLGLEPMTIGASVEQLLAPRLTQSPPDALQPMVKKPSLSELLHYRGQLIHMFADPANTGGTLCAWSGECPRGLGPPVHIHTREHEAFYITKGRLRVGIEDRVWVVSPGGFVFLPANRPHWFAPVSPVVEMLGLTVPVEANDGAWTGQGTMFRTAGEPATCLSLPPYPDDPEDVDALVNSARELGIVVLEPNPMMFAPANYSPRALFRKATASLRRRLLEQSARGHHAADQSVG